jgi:hypothetical protein
MDEDEYWMSLRFRINSFSRSVSRRLALPPGWCDWFEPQQYVLDGPSPCIMGRVGFVGGRNAWERRFILLLGRPIGSLSDVEWEKLLPPEDSDGWLWPENNGEVIVIDPCDSKGSIAEQW